MMRTYCERAGLEVVLVAVVIELGGNPAGRFDAAVVAVCWLCVTAYEYSMYWSAMPNTRLKSASVKLLYRLGRRARPESNSRIYTGMAGEEMIWLSLMSIRGKCLV